MQLRLKYNLPAREAVTPQISAGRISSAARKWEACTIRAAEISGPMGCWALLLCWMLVLIKLLNLILKELSKPWDKRQSRTDWAVALVESLVGCLVIFFLWLLVLVIMNAEQRSSVPGDPCK